MKETAIVQKKFNQKTAIFKPGCMPVAAFKKSFVYALIFGLMSLFTGCIENVVEVEIPKSNLKLVVYSFLNPADTVIEATVSRSVPVVGPLNNGTPDYVTDATVTISDGTTTATLVYDATDKVYRTKALRAESGKTYNLTATAPGGYKVKATCQVPGKRNTSLQISFDSVQATGDAPKDYFVKARWTDLPGAGDFYKLDFEAEFNLNWTPQRFQSLQPDVPTFSDENKDGQPMKGQSAYSTALGEGLRTGDLVQVTGYLLTSDFHYARYHETLHRYQYTNTFSEPVIVYSNIEGGLGCFGAYQVYYTTIKP